jgi:hypothetical protein
MVILKIEFWRAIESEQGLARPVEEPGF